MDLYIPDLNEFPNIITIDLTNYFREQLVYLFFHLTRKNDQLCIKNIGSVFNCVLQILKKELYSNREKGRPDSDFPYLNFLDLFYRLVIHTRDLYYGKGEHDLFYMLVYELYKEFPSLAVYLLYQLENFGSWRDLKYLCLYIREHSNHGIKDGLIRVCIELMNRMLKKDLDIWKGAGASCLRNQISSIAKWIPREKPRFKWLFELLVIHWANHYENWRLSDVLETDSNYKLALNKCKKNYRKILSSLNTILDTTEIKQCSQHWDEINVSNISKYTIMKQPRLFLSYYTSHYNSNVKGSKIISISDIRRHICKIKCSQKHIENIYKKNSSLDNLENVDLIQLPASYYVKEAFRILKTAGENHFYKDECDLLNYKWEQFSRSQSYLFINTLPILDISYKMQENDAESFYVGIGLSLLIAQNSSFGKRILCLENSPVWINLKDCEGFVSMIEILCELIRSHNNTAFSFEKGIQLLVDAMSESKYNSNVKLVLFSNRFGEGDMDNYYSYFENQFYSRVPKLIFWNLSKKGVFDIADRVYANALLLSGFSSNMLRMISDCKSDDCSYDFICRELNRDHYLPFSDYLNKLLNLY
uniref:DUF7788 domain-containing protein n=1 Tax=viral metagenome TaxID=1070528 RepID=A0A6C0JL72_9ZZZZ